MAYSTARIWYGPESYQHATFYAPASHAATDSKPCIVYRPGGGWAGGDPADLESRAWWASGLNSGSSAYQEDYVVFVIQTASVGYNRRKATGVTAWADGATYVLGDYRGHVGRLWVCIDAHTPSSAANDAPSTGTNWEDYWREVGYNETGQQQVGTLGTATHTLWANATAYTAGAYRSHGGKLWACIAAHTSVLATNEPGVGSAWQASWVYIGRNESVASLGLGECAPGGLDEMVSNVQQAIGYLRRNAALYGISPTKICLAGASAGGQMAGCAAYAEELPWAREYQVYGAARDAITASCRPNAVLLSISPVDLRQHTVYGLLNGLYGESRTNTEWVALPQADKDAMSPQRVLQRTGLSLPTYLDYAWSTFVHGDGGADSYGNGSPYHHPDNGWAMIHTLAAARPVGFGRSDCRFLEVNPASIAAYNATVPPGVNARLTYRVYTSQTSSTTSVGTAGDSLANNILAAANHMLAWLGTVMA